MMDPDPIATPSSSPYDPSTDDYLITAAKAHVSRNATIHGASQLELKGRSVIERDCVLQADIARISIGQYCYIRRNTLIHPPEHTSTKKPIPVSIGAYTTIGANCEIHAAAIGSHCVIGTNVTIGKRAVIKDCCYLADNLVLNDDVVLPPFTRLTPCDRPELQWALPYTMELPVAFQTEIQEDAVESYEEFVKQREKRSN